MALVQINKNPSRRDLNWFGALFAFFFGLLGAVAWRRYDSWTAARVLWGVGAVVPLLYYAIPPLRRPIYLGWSYLAFPIGIVVSYVVLASAYYLIFVPVGLVMRVVGYDPLQRRFEAGKKTYWVQHRTAEDASRYFRQF